MDAGGVLEVAQYRDQGAAVAGNARGDAPLTSAPDHFGRLLTTESVGAQ